MDNCFLKGGSMILFQNKLLKLIKLAMKLINKLIFVIEKIEKTQQDVQSKIENLSSVKTYLLDVFENMNRVYKKLGDK